MYLYKSYAFVYAKGVCKVSSIYIACVAVIMCKSIGVVRVDVTVEYAWICSCAYRRIYIYSSTPSRFRVTFKVSGHVYTHMYACVCIQAFIL